jgi:hypothetical protein
MKGVMCVFLVPLPAAPPCLCPCSACFLLTVMVFNSLNIIKSLVSFITRRYDAVAMPYIRSPNVLYLGWGGGTRMYLSSGPGVRSTRG